MGKKKGGILFLSHKEETRREENSNTFLSSLSHFQENYSAHGEISRFNIKHIGNSCPYSFLSKDKSVDNTQDKDSRPTGSHSLWVYIS